MIIRLLLYLNQQGKPPVILTANMNKRWRLYTLNGLFIIWLFKFLMFSFCCHVENVNIELYGYH